MHSMTPFRTDRNFVRREDAMRTYLIDGYFIENGFVLLSFFSVGEATQMRSLFVSQCHRSEHMISVETQKQQEIRSIFKIPPRRMFLLVVCIVTWRSDVCRSNETKNCNFNFRNSGCSSFAVHSRSQTKRKQNVPIESMSDKWTKHILWLFSASLSSVVGIFCSVRNQKD